MLAKSPHKPSNQPQSQQPHFSFGESKEESKTPSSSTNQNDDDHHTTTTLSTPPHTSSFSQIQLEEEEDEEEDDVVLTPYEENVLAIVLTLIEETWKAIKEKLEHKALGFLIEINQIPLYLSIDFYYLLSVGWGSIYAFEAPAGNEEN